MVATIQQLIVLCDCSLCRNQGNDGQYSDYLHLDLHFLPKSLGMTITLEARDIKKNYGEVLAVDGVNFSVREGICFGLLGPNGAGKTTTVEIIEGVTAATSGEVFYYGEVAGSRFRQEAGIQFQNTALQDNITVRETVEMFRALYQRQANINDIVEQCSLGDLLDRDNRKLSGG
jgi:ABC-2 type transport system ATP-binding protein